MIILLTGFVFLVIYMKAVSKPKVVMEEKVEEVKPKEVEEVKEEVVEEKVVEKPKKKVSKNKSSVVGLVLIVASTAVTTSVVSSLVLKKTYQAELVRVEQEVVTESVEVEAIVKEVRVASDSADRTASISVLGVAETRATETLSSSSLEVEVWVPEGDAVLVFDKPGLRSKVSDKLWKGQIVELSNETEYWVKIIYSGKDGQTEGWVSKDFIES